MQDDDGSAGAGREEASGSVRVAIVIFMVTLAMLMVMGIIWMFIRVDAPPAVDEAAAVSTNLQAGPCPGVACPSLAGRRPNNYV